MPSNVGTTSCDLWESLGRGAYSQAYAGLLCDTRASQHHVWGFSPKLEILPNRETGWVEHSWNFFYFLIKRNKSHWNFLNINLSCQRIYLNIEWNLTISVKKPSTLIDLCYHHLHINHKNSMKKKIKFCSLHFYLPCEYCGSTVIRAPPAWWLWLVVGIVLFSCFILKTQFQFGWNSVDKDTRHTVYSTLGIYVVNYIKDKRSTPTISMWVNLTEKVPIWILSYLKTSDPCIKRFFILWMVRAIGHTVPPQAPLKLICAPLSFLWGTLLPQFCFLNCRQWLKVWGRKPCCY